MRLLRKLRGRRGGVNRVIVILLALIGVMLVIIALPSYQSYRYRAQKVGCEQAMKSAKDGLVIEFMSHWDQGSVEDAMRTLDEVMPERANICPAGGTVYLVRNDSGIFEPVCGLHDSDLERRTRLNASRAQELLAEELRKARQEGGAEPDSLEIRLNGRALECVRVRKVQNLHRGTRTTNGYTGIVACYGLAGEGDFSGDALEAGEIAYFVYADEDHCASWRAGAGWTGDAYSALY